MTDYWLKQTSDKPLFPELLWSRPENKQTAGKLLIIGGNQHGFVSPGAAFRAAEAGGIGQIRLLLPDSLRPYVGKHFDGGELAPSTPSGSFAKAALAMFLDSADWADGVLLAGDLGHNSETAIVLEAFLNKYKGQLTLTGDAIDYFLASDSMLLRRPNSLLVPSFVQLQKLIASTNFTKALTSNMAVNILVDDLHQFTLDKEAAILTEHNGQLLTAYNSQVCTTKSNDNNDLTAISAKAAVWWLQNPGKTLAAISTSLL